MPRHGLSVRGDSLYCPLAFSLDSYWNCENDCWHCYLRRLNHVWGKELRPTDPEETRKHLVNGLKNKNPSTPLAWCLKHKKTLRFGNKSDPFQPAELFHRSSEGLLRVLTELKWSAVIQTMCTEIMMEYLDAIVKAAPLLIVQPIISPGLERDWEVLERKRTTPVQDRLDHLRSLRKLGVRTAVNGEPFIPGFHSPKDFRDTVRLLREYGVDSYNTYNLHLNDFVAKRLASLGLDIEKIWYENQDAQWKKTLSRLLAIAENQGVRLGCPDFVNTGRAYVEPFNTCCGVDVPNPTTFNAITWKRRIQKGGHPQKVFADSWDGIGDLMMGRKVLEGTTEDMYTLKDAGIVC